MKSFLKYALLVLSVVAVALGYDDIGSRVEVGAEKTVAKIDSMLGSLDVKRKRIELSERALKKGIEGLRKAKIKARVKHDQFEQKIAPVNEKIAVVDQSLAKLRDYLESGESVEISGKTNSPEQLRQLADRVLQARKSYLSQKEGLLKSQQSLQQVIATLNQKQQDYQKRLTRLDVQTAEIETKSIALNAMQDASAAMGDSEETLAANVEQLEEKVNELFADVEGELMAEEERWAPSVEERQIESLEAIVSTTQDPADTIAEIDRILGEAK